MVKPYFERDGITILHGDCREIAPGLSGVDALVSDPPYGIDADTDSRRFTCGNRNRGKPMTQRDGRADWGDIHGDAEPFDPAPWLAYERVVPLGREPLQPAPPSRDMARVAQEGRPPLRDVPLRLRTRVAEGRLRRLCLPLPVPAALSDQGDGGVRPSHAEAGGPLMRWCLERLDLAPGSLVLDPYMGSGTTLIAARDLGLRAIGIEIEERYCEIAARRLQQQVFDMEPDKE